MRFALPICGLAVVLAGCVSDRDVSYAPGGTKTIVPFAVHKWQAPVILANHRFYDPATRVLFDIEIVSIDGKAFTDDGQRTKYYYHVDPGPHSVVVSCNLGNVKWGADFDFVVDAGDTVEITGELTEAGPVLWFADVKTGNPVTDKVAATTGRKSAPAPGSSLK